MKEMNGAECKSVSHVEHPVVLSLWSQDSIILPELMCDSTHGVLPTWEAHPSLGVQEFLSRLHHVGIIDCF